jgi:hypothetical protein
MDQKMQQSNWTGKSKGVTKKAKKRKKDKKEDDEFEDNGSTSINWKYRKRDNYTKNRLINRSYSNTWEYTRI